MHGVTGTAMEVSMGTVVLKEACPDWVVGQAGDEGQFPGRSDWSLSSKCSEVGRWEQQVQRSRSLLGLWFSHG